MGLDSILLICVIFIIVIAAFAVTCVVATALGIGDNLTCRLERSGVKLLDKSLRSIGGKEGDREELYIGLVETRNSLTGLTFFEALKRVDELNSKLGMHMRLISHRNAERLLIQYCNRDTQAGIWSDCYRDALTPYSPFWTSTVIGYESGQVQKFGSEIRSRHFPGNGIEYTAVLPTGRSGYYCDSRHALTMEQVTLNDIGIDDQRRTIAVRLRDNRDLYQGIKETKGFPITCQTLPQDGLSLIPGVCDQPYLCLLARRNLRVIRKVPPSSHPLSTGGKICPLNDAHICPIVRSARDGEDKIFIADVDFFDRYGLIVEIDPEDLNIMPRKS